MKFKQIGGIFILCRVLQMQKGWLLLFLCETKNLQWLYNWSRNVQLIVKHRPHNTETGHLASLLRSFSKGSKKECVYSQVPGLLVAARINDIFFWAAQTQSLVQVGKVRGGVSVSSVVTVRQRTQLTQKSTDGFRLVVWECFQLLAMLNPRKRRPFHANRSKLCL